MKAYQKKKGPYGDLEQGGPYRRQTIDWRRSMLQTSERGGGGLLVKLRPAWAQMVMVVRKYFKVKKTI